MMGALKRIAIVAALVVTATISARAQQLHVKSVSRVAFTVQNMDREVRFFTDVLTFSKVSEWEKSLGTKVLERITELRLGDEILELDQYTGVSSKVFPLDARPNDRSFQHVAIIVRDMDKAYTRLRAAGVRHGSSYPQTLPESIKGAAGIRAFYFRDPEGHYLEILQFPVDKGAEKWHRAGDDLFMGIDHTAIVVADTEASLAFYRDKLGMKVTGESENFGTEQEHLNGVFGAHLRITTLRAPDGPGIELLEYLTPTDGRAYPSESHHEDLIHWETKLQIEDVRALRALLSDEKSNVGEGAAELKDPDGHVLVLLPEVVRTAEKELQ